MQPRIELIIWLFFMVKKSIYFDFTVISVINRVADPYQDPKSTVQEVPICR
jgi:hypothetical protein